MRRSAFLYQSPTSRETVLLLFARLRGRGWLSFLRTGTLFCGLRLARAHFLRVPSCLLPSAAAACLHLVFTPAAFAELNKFEASTFGEFNRGSAQQFGGTNQRNVDFVKEYGKDLRLSNFTATEMRNSKLRGADLRGAYLIKAVAPDTDFSGADLTDALMDRAVFVNANFSDAVLVRTVLTLSDLNGANVENADFTDALLDKTQQQALCKTASGRNPKTGADTRKSLGCGGRPRGTPSAYMTDESSVKPEPLFEASRFSSYANQ